MNLDPRFLLVTALLSVAASLPVRRVSEKFPVIACVPVAAQAARGAGASASDHSLPCGDPGDRSIDSSARAMLDAGRQVGAWISDLIRGRRDLLVDFHAGARIPASSHRRTLEVETA